MDSDGCTVHTCQAGANLVSDNGANCKCNYNGMQYARGQTFPKPGDQCGNTCTCQPQGLQVTCTNKVCFCFGNSGQKYKIGLSWIHTDGCNTCTCTQTGMITCDTKKCECEYNGQKHRIG